MKAESNLQAFISVMQSLDAFFPIGAFTLSNGLEDYVCEQILQTSNDLQEYLHGFVKIFPYQDLGLAHLAYEHYLDIEYLCKLDHLAGAMKSSREVRVGSNKMAIRFLKARNAMNDCEGMLQWYLKLIKSKALYGFHPIALGIYSASKMNDEKTFLSMYGYSVLSAIVNNAVKLVPLSQMDGQRILYESFEELEDAVNKTVSIQMEELGVAGAGMEISCMRHEYLYSRQYMS